MLSLCLHLEFTDHLNQQFLDAVQGPWAFTGFFLFQLRICVRLDVGPPFSQTKYHNRLNAKGDVRIQLSSLKPDVKEIYRCATPLTIFFVLENIVVSQKKNYLC